MRSGDTLQMIWKQPAAKKKSPLLVKGQWYPLPNVRCESMTVCRSVLVKTKLTAVGGRLDGLVATTGGSTTILVAHGFRSVD